MNRKYYNESEWKSKDIKLFYLMTGLMGVFMGVMLFAIAVLLWSPAAAEESSCWILCRPGTDGAPNEVLIREKPQKRADVVGGLTAGTRVRTDWQEKGGWLHLVDVNNESGDGWVSERYIVWTEPREVNREMTINRNKVACRKWIGGEISRRAKKGQQVFVYMMNGEWAVTEWGYIQSEFLDGEEN